MNQRGEVMSIEIPNGSGFESGTPKLLFRVFLKANDACMGQYGVGANGQKFLVQETPASSAAAQMRVVTRWDASSPTFATKASKGAFKHSNHA